jgi:hypothetical protein
MSRLTFTAVNFASNLQSLASICSVGLEPIPEFVTGFCASIDTGETDVGPITHVGLARGSLAGHHRGLP